jgi:phosphatidate phosphatase APP1
MENFAHNEVAEQSKTSNANHHQWSFNEIFIDYPDGRFIEEQDCQDLF